MFDRSLSSVPADETITKVQALPTLRRYSVVAVCLHWAIAALIVWNLVTGFVGAHTEGPMHRQALDAHKPLGILILVLSLFRLSWRLAHRPPRADPGLSRWERRLANAVHLTFYAVMVAQPLTGWWLSSAVPKRHAFGISGLVDIPFLPIERSMASVGLAHDLHVGIALSTCGLLALHLAGVVKHHTVDRRNVLRTMWVA